MTQREMTKIIHTNWGYWDGVYDRQRAKMAKWYRSGAKNFGHFDADYARGYDIGIWGGGPPAYAVVEVFPKSLTMIEAVIDEVMS